MLDKIRYRLTNLTYDAGETSTLLEELDTMKKNFEEKQQLCHRLQRSVDNLQNSSKKLEEQIQFQSNRNQTLEKTLEQQKTMNNELQQENTRLSSLNARQLQDLKHLEQLRQSILTFEKKLDQKQTRVNELSMKIIEKEDIIETKVKECQKHRLELRELETKYYTLGKQLEEEIIGMTKEIEKLNVEKEMLRYDLESIRLTQQNVSLSKVRIIFTQKSPLFCFLKDRCTSSRSTAEDEITRIKSECRQQIIDGEIESYKLRLNQSHSEKDELLQAIKELEKKHKELQVKYDANEQSWTRLKTDMSDKQRKVNYINYFLEEKTNELF
jgi:chromosome segregation ATPase